VLPALLTAYGSTRNPFHDVASRDSEAARILAIAVRVAHDNDQIFAAVRGITASIGRSCTGVSGYMSGHYMLDKAGDQFDLYLLQPYARAYLGEEADAKDVAWVVDRFAAFVAA
jgi:hypothetical protein